MAFLSQDDHGTARTCIATLPDGSVTCPDAMVGSYPGPASPDGRRLLLVTPGPGGDTLATWTVGAAQPEHLAGPATPLREPAWSTDGQHVVFRGTLAGQIGTWRVPATGGRPERLSDAARGDFEPHMNHAGDAVFASSRDGNAELYERTSDGTLTRLTTHVHDDIHPRYAPDGSAIAWLSDIDGERHLMMRRGDEAAVLVGETGTSQHAFAWSPDSQSIAVVEHFGPSYRLVERRLGGGSIVVYDYDADPSPPSFSPDGKTLCWTSDGSGQVVVRCADVGGQVYDTVMADGTTDSWLPRLLADPG